MKIFRKIYAVVIVLLVSTTAFAASQDGTDNSQDMPMMNQDGGMMMSPEMMGQMKASGQHQNMAMMDHQAMQQMMHQTPYMGYGMPMMGGGMGNMMINPQMMQMPIQHMVKMEQHLEKIESLLAQILEAQKPR